MRHPESLDNLMRELMARQRDHDEANPDQTYLVREAEQLPEDTKAARQQAQRPRPLPLLDTVFGLD